MCFTGRSLHHQPASLRRDKRQHKANPHLPPHEWCNDGSHQLNGRNILHQCFICCWLLHPWFHHLLWGRHWFSVGWERTSRSNISQQRRLFWHDRLCYSHSILWNGFNAAENVWVGTEQCKTDTNEHTVIDLNTVFAGLNSSHAFTWYLDLEKQKLWLHPSEVIRSHLVSHPHLH